MTEQDATRSYIDRVSKALVGDGFRCTTAGVEPYLLVGEKSGFQLTKFGNVDTSVRIALLVEPTPESLAAFSAEAYAAAKATPRGFRMPNGFFNTLFSHAVAVAESVPDSLAAHVAQHLAPKHWSSFESLALFDVSAGRLHVFTGTPLWGAAYFASTRKLQQRLFG